MGIKDSSLWAREILSFLETAKNGSINGTAEANAMKQSNLSRTLKSLEEKLKCQLLERGYNGVRLTENGREVFKVACDLDKVIYKVKNFTISDKNVSGKIRLWTSDGLGTGYLSNCCPRYLLRLGNFKLAEFICLNGKDGLTGCRLIDIRLVLFSKLTLFNLSLKNAVVRLKFCGLRILRLRQRK